MTSPRKSPRRIYEVVLSKKPQPNEEMALSLLKEPYDDGESEKRRLMSEEIMISHIKEGRLLDARLVGTLRE